MGLGPENFSETHAVCTVELFVLCTAELCSAPCTHFTLQRSGVKDRDIIMSAKVNMEASPKDPERTPLDPTTSPPGETVLICGSDGMAKKARPQPHTTTAFLLPGEHRLKDAVCVTVKKTDPLL